MCLRLETKQQKITVSWPGQLFVLPQVGITTSVMLYVVADFTVHVFFCTGMMVYSSHFALLLNSVYLGGLDMSEAPPPQRHSLTGCLVFSSSDNLFNQYSEKGQAFAVIKRLLWP